VPLAVFFIRFHHVNTHTKINHASIFCVPPTTCGYELRDAAPSPEAVLEWVEASIDAWIVVSKEGNIKRREALCLSD